MKSFTIFIIDIYVSLSIHNNVLTLIKYRYHIRVNHINVQLDVIFGQVGNLELLVTYQQIWIAFKVPITLLTEFPLFLSLNLYFCFTL